LTRNRQSSRLHIGVLQGAASLMMKSIFLNKRDISDTENTINNHGDFTLVKKNAAYLLALILCCAAFAGCEANRYVVVNGHDGQGFFYLEETSLPVIITSAEKARDFYYENFVAKYGGDPPGAYIETIIREKYNDSFFESRNLLFVGGSFPVYGYAVSIKDIYLSDNVLNVEILGVSDGGLYPAIVSFRYFMIEIDKSLYSNTINVNRFSAPTRRPF